MLSVGTWFSISKLFAGLGLHSVLPLTISAPSSSRSKCLHSTCPLWARLPTLASDTAVRDWSTLSLPHSLLYSKVIEISSWLSKIDCGALCNNQTTTFWLRTLIWSTEDITSKTIKQLFISKNRQVLNSKGGNTSDLQNRRSNTSHDAVLFSHVLHISTLKLYQILFLKPQHCVPY